MTLRTDPVGAVEDEVVAAVGAEPPPMPPTRPQWYMTGGTVGCWRGCGRPGRRTRKDKIVEHLRPQHREACIQCLFNVGQGRGRMLRALIVHTRDEFETADAPLLGGVVTAHDKSSPTQEHGQPSTEVAAKS